MPKANPNTPTPAIADLNKIMHECINQCATVEVITPIIEKHIAKAVSSAIEDQFSYYGDITKAIKQAVTNSMNINLDLGLPAYNDIVAKLVKEEIENSILTDSKAHLQLGIAKIFELPPKTIKLTELIEKYVEDIEQHREDHEGGYFTCIIDDHDGKYSFYDLYLDDEEKTEKHRCEVNITISKSGGIIGLKSDWRGNDQVTSPVPPRYLNGFKKLAFNLYATGSTIIYDEEDLEEEGSFTWGNTDYI